MIETRWGGRPASRPGKRLRAPAFQHVTQRLPVFHASRQLWKPFDLTRFSIGRMSKGRVTSGKPWNTGSRLRYVLKSRCPQPFRGRDAADPPHRSRSSITPGNHCRSGGHLCAAAQGISRVTMTMEFVGESKELRPMRWSRRFNSSPTTRSTRCWCRCGRHNRNRNCLPLASWTCGVRRHLPTAAQAARWCRVIGISHLKKGSRDGRSIFIPRPSGHAPASLRRTRVAGRLALGFAVETSIHALGLMAAAGSMNIRTPSDSRPPGRRTALRHLAGRSPPIQGALVTKAKRSLGEYLRENFYITASGNFHTPSADRRDGRSGRRPRSVLGRTPFRIWSRPETGSKQLHERTGPAENRPQECTGVVPPLERGLQNCRQLASRFAGDARSAVRASRWRGCGVLASVSSAQFAGAHV